MSTHDQIVEVLERATATLRAQLERDLSAFSEQLTQASEAAVAAVRRQADAQVAAERDRAAQQAAEAAAADMRHQAEMHAQVTQIEDAAGRQIEEAQRAMSEERAARQAAEAAAADELQRAEEEIAKIRDAAHRQADEIRRAAGQERERAIKMATEVATAEVRRDADTHVAQLRHAAQKQAEEIKRTAEGQVAEIRSALQAQLDEVRRAAHTQAEEARRTAQTEVEEARRTAESQVEDARRMAAAQVDDVQRGVDEQLEQTRQQMQAQIDEAHARSRGDLEKARGEIERVRAEGEAAVRSARGEAEEIVIGQLSAAQAEADKKIAEAVERTRNEARQAELAFMQRLAESISRLDEARSLGDVLDGLAACAARHVPRAAVLIVKDDKLRLRRLAGFAGEPGSPEVERANAGIAGAVFGAGVPPSRAVVDPAKTDDGELRDLPSFARDAGPRHAIALPVRVGGRVVAVLYGDMPPTDESAARGRWATTLEVLARHGGRALEAMTVRQAAGVALRRSSLRASAESQGEPSELPEAGDEESARRYARLLVSEIRMYHESLVESGRQSRDLRSRLGGEIDRARRLYEERVPQTIRQRSDFFEQELVRTLADGDRSLLG